MPTRQITEEQEFSMTNKMEKMAEGYVAKHEKVFEEVSQSPMFDSKVGREFGMMDAYVLGESFKKFEEYTSWVHENSSASELGTLPAIAQDLIAATYGLSISPLVASMQSIEEQNGIVYFKEVKASDTRGGVAAGDTLVTAKEGWKKDFSNYGSEKVEDEEIACVTAGVLTFSAKPIRSNIAIPVTMSEYSTFSGQIVNGILMSNGVIEGLTGAFDYTTGELTVAFTAATLTAGNKMVVTYMQDFEKSDDIPEIEMSLTSGSVFAEVLAVKEMIGTLKSFQFNKRFGKLASDEALSDLAGSLAAIESTKMCKTAKALANAQNPTPLTWSKTKATGISEFEHRQAFKYALNTVDTSIGTQAGRGFANRYIAGTEACEYFLSLNGFMKSAPNSGVGPHLYGYLDGVPVIKAYTFNGIDSNEVIALYVNPTSPFEAPIVQATYMPVFMTNTMQVSNNPLQNQRAIASWKAYEGVVSEFTRRLTIVA